MRVRATISSLLIAISLCLCGGGLLLTSGCKREREQAPVLTGAQQEEQQAAVDNYRAYLDKILDQHKLCLESKAVSECPLDLSRVSLFQTGHLVLVGKDLRGAHLQYADLRGQDLTDADLSGANFHGADLSGAVFEPKSLPIIEWIADAEGLELMRYDHSPARLNELRKEFMNADYRDQERAITCVLNRHDADPHWLWTTLRLRYDWIRGRPVNENYINLLPLVSAQGRPGFPEVAFRWIAFDLTCAYGFRPGRPLWIVLILWLLFSIIYTIFIHRSGTSGIYFVGTRLWRGKSNTQAIQIRPRNIHAAKWWRLPFLWLLREWRVLRAAMFFSLMSAFNIGFREINFGVWLRKLTKREYDLKAIGWARTVSGFQSLLSVYLIALWVLTYFGRPFG
jgi:Pentapeptide repeats (8 copies)